MRNEVLLDKLSEVLMNVLLAETKDHADWELRSVMDASPPDPERLDRLVIQPGLQIKQVHAAPMDKRSLLDTAKLPAAQATPTSRTSADEATA
jgi:hypothetical protein